MKWTAFEHISNYKTLLSKCISMVYSHLNHLPSSNTHPCLAKWEEDKHRGKLVEDFVCNIYLYY